MLVQRLRRWTNIKPTFAQWLATALWIHIQVFISDSLGGAGAYLWVSVEEVCCLQPEWLLCEILYIYPSLLNPAFLKRLVPTIEQHFYQLFIQATVAMFNKSTLSSDAMLTALNFNNNWPFFYKK